MLEDANTWVGGAEIDTDSNLLLSDHDDFLSAKDRPKQRIRKVRVPKFLCLGMFRQSWIRCKALDRDQRLLSQVHKSGKCGIGGYRLPVLASMPTRPRGSASVKFWRIGDSCSTWLVVFTWVFRLSRSNGNLECKDFKQLYQAHIWLGAFGEKSLKPILLVVLTFITGVNYRVSSYEWW